MLTPACQGRCVCMLIKRRAFRRLRFEQLLLTITALCFLGGCDTSKPPKTQESAATELKQTIPAGSTIIKGAGATFPSLLYKRWFSAYHDIHPDTFIEYAAVGSGEGIRRFIGQSATEEEQVDFGASDAAMTDQQLAEVNNNALMVPATAGCVVLAYNLPDVSGELKLSRQAYAGIFLGEITSWNHPLIAKSNPGIKLPKLTIVTVVRQDSSGTTFAFTRNLDAVNEQWRAQFGPATLVNWPGNAMRAKGNEGVAGLIQNSAGSIGYVGYEFARRIGLNVATLENKSGDFIKPSPQSCAAGLATVMLPDNLRAFVPDPDGSDSYPVVTLSWILLRKSYQNHDTAKALGSLLQWSLHDGQNYASELGYVPLPSAVVDKAAAAVSTISP